MIEGLVQEIKYNSSVSKLLYVVRQNGKEKKPDSAPTIVIYNPSGTELVASSSMTMVAVDKAGGNARIDYDGQTVNFNPGAKVLGGTSAAYGYIENMSDAGATGTLVLSGVIGTFANDEAITDDGDTPGAAVVNGSTDAAYTCEYSKTIDSTSTTNWPIGEDYYAVVSFVISSTTYTETVFFDVVRHPFYEPIVTAEVIDRVHPDWSAQHPDGDAGKWTEIINYGHAELARRIRSLGNRPAFMVRREEMFPYELAFIEAEAAKRLFRLPREERDFYMQQAENIWAGRGEFRYDTDDDTAVDTEESNTVVLSSRFTL